MKVSEREREKVWNDGQRIEEQKWKQREMGKVYWQTHKTVWASKNENILNGLHKRQIDENVMRLGTQIENTAEIAHEHMIFSFVSQKTVQINYSVDYMKTEMLINFPVYFFVSFISLLYFIVFFC